MPLRKSVVRLTAFLVALALVAAVALSHQTWRGWLFPQKATANGDEAGHQHHGDAEQVQLTPQAMANLRLKVKSVHVEPYWRTLTLPGMVVERPGKSDRGVTASIAGVVRAVKAVPGDTVKPGDELFTLGLTSESVQNSQTELYKSTQEQQITLDEKKRLEKSNLVPEVRLRELDYQLQRFGVTVKAQRQDLAARGLTPEQIDAAAQGKFVREITVRAPSPADLKGETEQAPLYEVEDLKVQLGEQVQAGQVLCTLANHQSLFIEGRVFKHEVPLLEQAVRDGTPVRAEVADAASGNWSALSDRQILFLGSRVDPASQTVPVYLPLANESREYQSGGKTYRLWRFRPGQRVRLQVPIEEFRDGFVLPVEAVVREGLEAYVFRQNGDVFQRKPVRILYADRRFVVVANDGSLFPGNHIAQSAAAQLNRALKAQAGGGEGHGHDHAEHDHSGHSH